ncbi:hypothetical protein [Telluribacter sp. SYSU D00476]|uniref:hypothetical protein n=1 Tax=Telluribacter sp. SYSU D00476 TaxID=2811430 RepID=UPI001FF6A799|nr:hypothetical protein [Telluribacter sp. SYSU D00476]
MTESLSWAKHGVHRYDLEQFGFTKEQINHTYKVYIERLGPEADEPAVPNYRIIKIYE